MIPAQDILSLSHTHTHTLTHTTHNTTQAMRLHEAINEIVRRVRRAECVREMEAERARRVAEDKRFVVCEELRRVCAAKEADAAAAAEREARVAAGPVELPPALHDVNEDITHRGNRADAAALAQCAIDENRHERVMRLVCEEVERAVSDLHTSFLFSQRAESTSYTVLSKQLF